MTGGNISGYKDAQYIEPTAPQAKHMRADRGYDANSLREGLREHRIEACIVPILDHKERFYSDKNATPSNVCSACRKTENVLLCGAQTFFSTISGLLRYLLPMNPVMRPESRFC